MRFEDKAFCSPREGFEYLNVGPTKGWSLIRKGKLEARYLDGKTQLVVPSVLKIARDAPPVKAGSMSKKFERIMEARRAARAKAAAVA